jgi:hypothetical protein
MPTSIYDTLGLVSDSIKDYYQTARGIPGVNIVPLSLPDSIPIDYQGVSHWVGLRQQNEVI